jgi:ribosome-binding factor A
LPRSTATSATCAARSRHRVNLKFAPELRFRRDEAFDEALRIDRLLYSDKVRRDLVRPAEAEGDNKADDADV